MAQSLITISMREALRALAYAKTKLDNVASVVVTANVPPFTKPGQTIDVSVAAIGLASSLRGGNLILTELRGADGKIYALAQGGLTVSGVEVSAAGSEITVGVPTAGRIPGGAIIEREIPTPFAESQYILLNNHHSDFTTATAIVDAINSSFGGGTANALDGTSIAVLAPKELSGRVSFLSMIENLEVTPGTKSEGSCKFKNGDGSDQQSGQGYRGCCHSRSNHRLCFRYK